MLGEQIGPYRIVHRLGEGGMGVVWVGEHVELGHRVAVKQLLPELSQHPEMVQRFINEAKAATRIRNAGIVQVLEFGRHDGSAWFAMELLDGQSLTARLRELTLRADEAVAVARQLANTLAVAHAQGIVHRDLKPDNVFLVADAEVASGQRTKILDFGIAKLAAEHAPSMRTRTGAVMGTPYYMSPEQCRGAGEIDHRTDVYALGCMLFEMLCGRPPFTGDGVGELLGKHQHVAAPRVASINPRVAPGVDELVARMLAKSPADRPQSMGEVARALEGLTSVPPVTMLGPERGAVVGTSTAGAAASRSRRVSWAGLAVIGGIGGAIGLWVALARGTGSGASPGAAVASATADAAAAQPAPAIVDAAPAMPTPESRATLKPAPPRPLLSIRPGSGNRPMPWARSAYDVARRSTKTALECLKRELSGNREYSVDIFWRNGAKLINQSMDATLSPTRKSELLCLRDHVMALPIEAPPDGEETSFRLLYKYRP